MVVGDYGLRDGLSHGVDLGCVASASDTNSDVDIGELVETYDEKWFVDLPRTSEIVMSRKWIKTSEKYLESEDLRLNEIEWFAVDFDKAFASLETC